MDLRKMALCLIFGIAMLFGTSSQGWGVYQWDSVSPASDVFEPTPRMFMELVWAVYERLQAATLVPKEFYSRVNVDTAVLSPEFIFSTNNYLNVVSNYSDMLESWVVETNAVYKDEYWEPSLKNWSDLVWSVYYLKSFFDVDTNTVNNSYSSYYPKPETRDFDVPAWVYDEAENIVWDYESEAYMDEPPMPYLWNKNPKIGMETALTVYETNFYPIDVVEMPIAEVGTNGSRVFPKQLLRRWKCVSNHDGTYSYIPDDIDEYDNQISRFDDGFHSCTSLVVRYDVAAREADAVSYSFSVVEATRETTDLFDEWFGDYIENDEEASPFLYSEFKGVRFMRKVVTNFYAGTLPMEIFFSNSVPVNIEIFATGTNQFGDVRPSIVAEMTEVKPIAAAWDSNYGLRDGHALWAKSWSILKHLQSIVTNMTRSNVRMCGSEFYQKILSGSTNVPNPSEDISCSELFMYSPTEDDESTIYGPYLDTPVKRYDFNSREWTDGTAEGFYGALSFIDPAYVPIIVANYKKNSSVSKSKKNGYGFKLYYIRKYCVRFGGGNQYSLVENIFPQSAQTGCPFLESVDVYRLVGVNSNSFLNTPYGGTFGMEQNWYPQGQKYYAGTWNFDGEDLVKVTGGNVLLECGKAYSTNGTLMGTNDWLGINGYDYLGAANVEATRRWGGNCYFHTNSTGDVVLATKGGEATVYEMYSGVGKWRFTTNFNAWWERY